MTLNAIANGLITAVSENIPLSIQVSTGYTVQGDGKPVPTYAAPVTVNGQVQPLSYKDIQQADSMNLQGTRKSIYINGFVEGLVRTTNQGGDLITVLGGPNAGFYLVAQIEENWAGGWCKAICTLQNGS